MSGIEKWAIGVLGVIALIMFFFPLFTTNIPIVGERSFTGYDIVRHEEATSSVADEVSSPEPSPNLASWQRPPELNIPTSLEYMYLIRIWIAIGFVGALMCIVGMLASRHIAAIGSLLGVAFVLLAVVHIKIANSDAHRMFEEFFAEMRNRQGGDLLSGITELFAGGMNFTPGLGLYLMAGILGVAAFLINTGLLRKVRLVKLSSAE